MAPTQISDRTLQAATAMRRAASLLQRRLRREVGEGGLHAGQATMLGHLARSQHPPTPGELAAAEGLQPQSVTRVLADLEQRGWVDRTPDPIDGRQARIAITDAGSYALAREAEERDRWLAAAMTRELSPAERALLRAAADLLTRCCAPEDPLTDADLAANAVPILPMHDAGRTREFLAALGFDVAAWSDDGYLIAQRGGIELHYQRAQVDPFATAQTAFLWVPDVDAFRAGVVASWAARDGAIAVLDAADGAGDRSELQARWERDRTVARIGVADDKPWRVREVACFDPANNLLRVGHPIGLNRRKALRRRSR